MDAILVAMEQWTAAHCAFISSRGGGIPWPARYPYLSVCDYFLWGYLKPRAHLRKPSDIDELKYAVKDEITATPNNMVREAMRSLCDKTGGVKARWWKTYDRFALQEVKYVTDMM